MARLSEVCSNMIETGGCGIHKMNLLQNGEVKEKEIRSIISFAEKLSNFMENKTKVHSMLRQTEKYLGLCKITDYSPTRFLSLYNMLVEVCYQFPLIQKVVQLSKDSTLQSYSDDPLFIIELDQFLIHVEPIYEFTETMQSPNLDLLNYLRKLLELLQKLLQRLGHSLEVTPQNYISILYHKDGTPRNFQSKMQKLCFDNESPHINAAMNKLHTHEIKKICQRWNLFNEKQLNRLLTRFSKRLQSEIARHCYLLKEQTVNDKYLKNLARLCSALN